MALDYLYRHLVSNMVGDSPIILERGDGVETGYMVTDDAAWPTVESAPVGDDSPDGEGMDVSGESLAARVYEIPLLVSDTLSPRSQARVFSAYESLANMVRRVSQNGGRLRMRPRGINRAVELDIQHATLAGRDYDTMADGGPYIRTTLVLTCKPFALGDPYDVWDDFATDTLGVGGRYNNLGADWTEGDAASPLSVSGGQLGVTNLLSANAAGIETSAAGWTARLNCAVSRVVTQQARGSAALQMSSTAGGTMEAQTLTGTSGAAVTAGATYSAGAVVKTAVSARTCSVAVEWYTAAGALISTTAFGTGVSDATATWTGAAVRSVVAPATAAFASVIVRVAATGGAAEVHYVDEAWLVPGTSLDVEQVLHHTGTARVYGDVQVSATFTPGVVVNGMKLGVIIKRVDASNYLEAYVDDNGGTSRLRVDVVIAGVRTNIATTNLATRLSANAGLVVVRGGIASQRVWAHVIIPNQTTWYTAVPHYLDRYNALDATASVSALLASGSQENTFGMTVTTARVGLVMLAQSASTACVDFDVRAFMYGHTWAAEVPNPANIPLRGVIAGSAPALVEPSWRAGVATGSEASCLFAWMPTPEPYNLLELATLAGGAPPPPWSTAIVAGVVTAAATSLTTTAYPTSTPRRGGYTGRVVCPATADSGVSRYVGKMFLPGVTYTASVRVQSATATTNVVVKLGVNGDLATSTAVALGNGWQQLTVTWRPTATRQGAYFAVAITAATASTFDIGEPAVYEGTTAPTVESGGQLCAGVVEAEAATTFYNCALTADANASGGAYAAGAGGSQNRAVSIPIIGWPLRRLARRVALDVFGILRMATAATGAIIGAQINQDAAGGGSTFYAGLDGALPNSASFRRPGNVSGSTGSHTHYLGQMSVDTAHDGFAYLVASATDAAAVNVGWDAFVFAPVGHYLIAHTNSPNASPAALQDAESARVTYDGRLIRSHAYRIGESTRSVPPQIGGGYVIGSPMRFRPGVSYTVAVMATTLDIGKGDTIGGASVEDITASRALTRVQFAVTPRYHLAEVG